MRVLVYKGPSQGWCESTLKALVADVRKRRETKKEARQYIDDAIEHGWLIHGLAKSWRILD